MTDVKKKTGKKSGTAAAKKAAPRDAYDDFLDGTDAKTTVKKKTSSGKTSAVGKTVEVSKVEPGIGMISKNSGAKRADSKKTRRILPARDRNRAAVRLKEAK